jgi:Lon protease-like protein
MAIYLLVPFQLLVPFKISAEVFCRIARDLVQEDSPFRGTKRFGMCFVSNDGLAALGTVLEIVKHAVFDDGRMLVLCKGRERFCLKKIIAEKPVLRCTVKVLLPVALPFRLPSI